MPHEPNRALARQKLEALAWQNTPADYRSASGSRRQVLLNTTQGTTLTPLSDMTDNQLRRYIGPGALEEAGDMRKNGSEAQTERMLEKLKSEYRLHVATDDGKEFWILRKAWEGGPPYGYAPSLDGKRPSEKYRMFTPDELWQWLSQLSEVDDMRNNGSGIYTGTAASTGDYVIHKKGGQYHAASLRYYADRIGPRGTHQTIGPAKGSETKAAVLQAILKDAHTHGIRDGIIFEQTGDELIEIGDVRSGRHEPNARREEADEGAARELSLYIENEYSLVGAPNSRGKAIEKNLLGHMRRGNFDLDKAEIAYMYLMEDGAKKYAKEFSSASDWNIIFTKPTRELVAHEFATSFYEEHKGR